MFTNDTLFKKKKSICFHFSTKRTKSLTKVVFQKFAFKVSKYSKARLECIKGIKIP